MKTQISNSLKALLSAYIILQASLHLAHAQSNIVVNGGFELGTTGWETNVGTWVLRTLLVPEGSNILYQGTVAQTLNTVAGRDYVLQFAYRTTCPTNITWGGKPVTGFTNLAYSVQWYWVYTYLRAETDRTRLSIGGGNLDDIRVGWLQEPVSILVQPQSLAAYEGSAATFTVTAQGGPPLSYQWMFNDVPILQATNPALTMSPARAIQAGNYSVLVSNVAGSLLSTTAVFNVLPAVGPPVITMQPENRTVPAGYGVSFNVGATGTQPLAYQWYQDNNSLPAATNASLVFEAAQTTNAGAYTVLISNSIGTTLSLPAVLTVTNATGRGWLGYTNSTPICDADGITRLSGPAYLAQPYAGPSPSLLRPIGAPTPMSTGAWAGFFVTYVLSLPDIPTNGAVCLQLRAWEAAWGPCYEAARAAGGKFGFSEIKLATAKPVPSVRVPGFNLRAGLPFFFTGRLAIGDPLPDGTPQMLLYGQSGFRYLIEKQSPPNNWVPFLVVTNVSGTVVFPRAEASSDAVEFYRSRILD